MKLLKEIIGNDINDIEVIPKKLSKENYIEMLDGLNFFISQIFFKNKSPTQIPATREYLTSEIAGLREDMTLPKRLLLK